MFPWWFRQLPSEQDSGESGWFSGHQPCLPPLWPRFNSGLGSYVGWVSVDLNLTPRGFLRELQFSSLLKIDSRPIPSGCGAVLRGHTWVVFRGRAPSRQHSSFGPTSLSCALSNSVSDCEIGRLADQIYIYIYTLSWKHLIDVCPNLVLENEKKKSRWGARNFYLKGWHRFITN